MKGERKHPALGPGVWLVLLRNEWFKARHRPAFVITLGLFTFIQLMQYGSQAVEARRSPERSFGLPDAWADVLGSGSTVLLIFGCICVIMLVSSEFTWRTARQNVIDGLSKTQWFWGKALMVAIVGACFVAAQIVSGAGAAALGTDFAAGGALVPGSVWLATAGLVIAFFNLSALALLCSVTIRAAGPAMAVWFFWISLGEQLLPQIVGQVVPSVERLAALLPFQSSQQLLPFWHYDAATYARLVASATEGGNPVPELPNMLLWTALNAGWGVVFVAIAFYAFKRRDL